MKPLAALSILALAACNPARVEPGPSDHNVAAPEPDASAQRNAADGDALVENSEFNATGTVRCVTRAGWALRDCAAGVVRNRDGSAVVTIFHPEGRSRDIMFGPDKRATGVRTAEADGSDRQPFSATRAANATIVRLGPERYEIPDIMVQGDEGP
ncbi:MAG TPA: hypothetical protein VLK25_03625 [Allosphingosinicella sp.]|nr:hypothetical protein [Allosphingosinicella sp.]